MNPNVLEMPIHCDDMTITVTFTAVDGLIVVRVDNEYADTITEEEIPAVLQDLDFRLWEADVDPEMTPIWTAYDLTNPVTEQVITIDLGRHLGAILEWARSQPALGLS
jgi:hypothetical protein